LGLTANGPLNDLISYLPPGGAFRGAKSWSQAAENGVSGKPWAGWTLPESKSLLLYLP